VVRHQRRQLVGDRVRAPRPGLDLGFRTRRTWRSRVRDAHVATVVSMVASSSSVREGTARPEPRRSVFGVAWRIVKQTLGACFDYRVTGLAGEAAFFALLSLPPLIFGLAGSIGYVIGGFGDQAASDVKREIV